jgi:hypothetical protein
MGLLGAMPLFASDQGVTTKSNSPDSVRQCALQAESIQEKIKRLENEIAKGERKYSDADIVRLEKMLKDANDTLDGLMKR